MIHALLIGVDRYAHPGIRPLQFTNNDVDLLSGYLVEQCDRPRIIKLENERATRTEIVANTEAMLGDIGLGDRLLFYFSGHGCMGVNDAHADVTAYLAPHDADPTRIHDTGYELFVDLPALLRPVRRRGGRLLMVIDACFRATGMAGSRAFQSQLERSGRQLNLTTERLPPFQRMSIDKSDALLAATQTNEVALERDGNGLFTAHLIARARILAQTGPVRVQTLIDDVTRATSPIQTPLCNSWNASNARFPSRHDPR